MKALLFLLFVALASAQRTVTNDLVDAQNELTVGHEFAEIFLTENRKRLSDYLEDMELEILDSFLVAYADIKNTGIETREIMEGYTEPSACKDGVRARWELQVPRYGQKLSQCLQIADGYLKQFTGILNSLHDESRTYSNIIPNVGVNVLSTLDIFDGRDGLQTYINNGFRDLFFRAREFQQDFEEYIDEISLDRDEYVRQLTACFRSLPRAFDNESAADLESIRECFAE